MNIAIVGLGIIGADALKNVVLHPMLQNHPFILETPNDDSGYKKEIQTVKDWMSESLFDLTS